MRMIDTSGDAPEASALLAVDHEPLLRHYGFDTAFWACLDEPSAQRGLVLIGHASDEPPEQGWSILNMRGQAKGDDDVETEDAEALTRDDRGNVWMFGSQFGKKSGPLAPSRAFVARFDERELSGPIDGKKIPMQIRRRPFALHRAINDAFVRAGLELIPIGPNVKDRYIAKTMRKNHKQGHPWATDVRVEDWPVNVEGAQFVGDDTFLLGLRYPTTHRGEPIIVRARGLGQWFNGCGPLEVEVAAVLSGISDRSHPLGIRAMDLHDDEIHAIVGPIGSRRKPTAIDIDYPESTLVQCSHVRIPVPSTDDVSHPEACVIDRFENHPNVEGIARSAAGVWHYAIDDDDRLILAISDG